MISPTSLGNRAKAWLLVLPLIAGVTALAAEPSDSDSTHSISAGENSTLTTRRAITTRAVYHPSSRKTPEEVAPGVVLTSRQAPRPVILYQAAASRPGEILYLNDTPAVVQHPMNVAARITAPATEPAVPEPSTEVRRATIVSDDEAAQVAPPRAEVVGPPDAPAAPEPPKPARKILDPSKFPVAQPSKHSWYRVVSPFPPYHEMDVTSLAPGSLARDPTCGKIFRLP